MATLAVEGWTEAFPGPRGTIVSRTGWRFVVDGTPLVDGQDLVWFSVPVDTPTFRSGRTTIMTCGLCADEGCGALAAKVRVDGDEVVWSDFARQDAAEDPILNTTVVLDWPPMRFARKSYDAVMAQLPSPVARWA